MHVTILTLYPEAFPGLLGIGLLGKALERGLWSLHIMNIRDFATDRYKTVDDEAFGGGAGMVLMPEVVDAALLKATDTLKNPRCVYLSPCGLPFTQKLAESLITAPLASQENSAHAHTNTWLQNQKTTQPAALPSKTTLRPLVLLCGRFEGLDKRVIDKWNLEEWSLGDFVLMGGEAAAMAITEAIIRLIPNVVGNHESLKEESFQDFLLEYPHYTRPQVWEDRGVPEVLLSGHHEKIKAWRHEQRLMVTQKNRPDLYKRWTQLEGYDTKK